MGQAKYQLNYNCNLLNKIPSYFSSNKINSFSNNNSNSHKFKFNKSSCNSNNSNSSNCKHSSNNSFLNSRKANNRIHFRLKKERTLKQQNPNSGKQIISISTTCYLTKSQDIHLTKNACKVLRLLKLNFQTMEMSNYFLQINNNSSSHNSNNSRSNSNSSISFSKHKPNLKYSSLNNRSSSR